ncbi:hypothetical protein RvY_06199-1 [Ramazzottius varieornatus]|uniref:EB domain-containing protein n=1 Tax=Ramazzottius varieornatus TaxID=947166 RepID=A0A1D1UY93_RAMVA|nr:hypothetical protein RvY_06199-1 [Ramazzottius varieornatus]
MQTCRKMRLRRLALVMTSCLSCLLIIVTAKNKGEFCFATMDCSDAGLFCTGATCQCMVDIDPEHGKFWGCNTSVDCDGANAIVQQALPAEVANKSEPPLCTISQQCTALPGYSGYCYFSLLP